jgi:hypothetical protein
MDEMKEKLPLTLFEDESLFIEKSFCSDIHRIITWKNGKVYLSNPGDYLMSREHVRKVLGACSAYLEHISDEEIGEYNKELLDFRRAERS